MKVYLAGKIAGDPHYKEKFAKWAKKLEVPAGATVVSPAVLPEGMEKADYTVRQVLDLDPYKNEYVIERRWDA